MGTIARLNTAKKKLAQAEQAMPGAYQNNYTDSINQKLVQLADASLTGSTGVDTDALNAAYQQYRANSVANAQNGAAAGTANTLAGGYGADWAKTAANQAAGEQIAGVDNSLSSLRADALQNWKQKMSDTTSVLDDLLGQQSLERSEYDGSVSNAQNWRDYLSGRVDTEHGTAGEQRLLEQCVERCEGRGQRGEDRVRCLPGLLPVGQGV